MVTIKKLIDIEEILLKADNDFRYEYSMDELIKSERYLKELGEMTNIFFSIQIEYGKINGDSLKDYKQKLVDYHNKLISDEIDMDITKYIEFIDKSINSKNISDIEFSNKIKKILA